MMYKKFNFLSLVFKEFKWQILFCCIAVLLWTLLEGILLYTIKVMVDYNYIPIDNLQQIILIFAGIYFIIELLIKITNFIVLKFLPTCLEKLQKKLVEILVSQEAYFYHDKEIEGIISKIVNLSNVIENIFKTFLYGFIAGIKGFIVTIVLINISSTWLAYCFVIWFAIMILISISLAKRTNNYAIKFAKANNNLVDKLNDIFLNLITIKSFQKENYELNRYAKNISSLKDIKQNFELFLFNTDLLRSAVSVLFFVLLIYFSIKGISQNETTLGDLVFVISVSLICKKDIWRISLQIIDIHKNWGFVQDVIDLLNLTKQSLQSDNFSTSENPLQSIEFKNVYFHANNIALLKDVSLSINNGEKIAIIGTSGSGKTTIAKLLACLYYPTSGQILLNQEGQNSRGNQLTKHIIYIDQNVTLFNRTIKENIFYNQENIDSIPIEKIENILSLSLFNNFINTFPNKLDTKVKNLSLGQKHLVAIARIINELPNWLILDEPCVFLDPITEEKLITNILELVRNKTLIVITHSPKILKLMDRILIIEAGKITADSKFEDLNQNEFYRKFINYGK